VHCRIKEFVILAVIGGPNGFHRRGRGGPTEAKPRNGIRETKKRGAGSPPRFLPSMKLGGWVWEGPWGGAAAAKKKNPSRAQRISWIIGGRLEIHRDYFEAAPGRRLVVAEDTSGWDGLFDSLRPPKTGGPKGGKAFGLQAGEWVFASGWASSGSNRGGKKTAFQGGLVQGRGAHPAAESSIRDVVHRGKQLRGQKRTGNKTGARGVVEPARQQNQTQMLSLSTSPNPNFIHPTTHPPPPPTTPP